MKPVPFGSDVQVESRFDGVRIALPKPKRTTGDWGSTLFLAFWLCGWAFGEWFAASALLKNGLAAGAGWFLVAWLGGWTVGGIMAMRALYDKIKGPSPEIIVLNDQVLTHQRGKKTDYEKSRLGKVVLERADGTHLLYFDYGADRIFIGEHLREPEREWLHDALVQWKGALGASR